MKKVFMPAAFLLLTLLVLAGCSAAAHAGSSPDLILRYAENQPEDYPTTQAAYAFAEMVSERTQGRVQVNVFAEGELGSERSVIEQVIYGGIDLSRVSLSELAEHLPSLYVLQLPFLYEDAEHMWQVLDSDLGDEYLDSLSAVHIIGLSWYDGGVRNFYSRGRISTLEDLSGLRIRVQESAFMSEMIGLLGGIPVQMVYSQVYMALRRGEIDAAENNYPSYSAQKHFEVAPFILHDEHIRIPEIQMISENSMNEIAALDPGFPDIIRECARESSLIERSLWAERELEAEQAMRDAGVIITEVSEEERERFRSAVQPLYDDYDL